MKGKTIYVTREEKIKEAAVERFGNNGNESQYMLAKIQAFIVGAKWADKTMIDKVCRWTEDNIENAFMSRKTGFMIELAGIEMSEDLRKVMEEEE